MGSPLKPGQVSLYLRQQGEVAGSEIFLDDLSREQALRLVARRGGEDRSLSHSAEPGAMKSEPPLGSLPPYEDLRAEAMACTRCELAKTRKQVVFSFNRRDVIDSWYAKKS